MTQSRWRNVSLGDLFTRARGNLYLQLTGGGGVGNELELRKGVGENPKQPFRLLTIQLFFVSLLLAPSEARSKIQDLDVEKKEQF